MNHTEMIPGKLYRSENHLYCLKEGQYYWLPYDHFAQRYISPWKRIAADTLAGMNLSLVTARNRTPGIRIHRDDAGRASRIEILTYGSQ
ncbi:MAG: hypothetical protein KBA30_01190 [Clostridia bacterium]|nr:hypothetical protein [Clostridia bacterium]